MITKTEVRAYLYPTGHIDHTLIETLSPLVAAWIKQYDPEFVRVLSTTDDEEIASEWMEMVSSAADDENPGAQALLDKLEVHLMEGAG